MKKILSFVLSLSIAAGLLCGLTLSAEAASPIENIYVNGKPLQFSEAEKPFIMGDGDNGRTMVPLRAVSEALGATVYWIDKVDDKPAKRIQIVRYDTTLRLDIGLPTMYVYKIAYDEEKDEQDQKQVETKELDAPAFQGDETRDFRTFVPIRAVTEAFGAEINAVFADNDESKIDRPMNVYIVDTYNGTNENKVSIADLYDSIDISQSTLISTVGVITRIYSKYYLQDENETYKMIELTNIPDVENFWTQQIGAPNNNPVGMKVHITGMVDKNEKDGTYSMVLRRGSTGILPVTASSSAQPEAVEPEATPRRSRLDTLSNDIEPEDESDDSISVDNEITETVNPAADESEDL